MQDANNNKVIKLNSLLPRLTKSVNAFDDTELVEYNFKIDLNFKAYKNQLFRLEQNIFPEFKKKINGILLKKVNPNKKD